MENIGTHRRRLERGRSERGFTLVELMVVVGIIGVLLAVAIPLLLGAQDRAKNASAKAKADTALKAQRIIHSDGGGYGTPAELELAEPTLTAIPLPDGAEATVLGAVYIRDVSDSTVTIVSKSAADVCFWAKQTETQVLFAKGSCNAADVGSLTFGSRWP